MLNVLLSPVIAPEEKIVELEEKYQIGVKQNLGGEIKEMCNLSEAIEEKALAKGMKKGREEGKSEGEMLRLVKQIQKKIQKNLEVTTIADHLEEPVDFIEQICQLIKENPAMSAEQIYELYKEEKILV